MTETQKKAALAELTACRDYITTVCMHANEAENPDPADGVGVPGLHPGEVLAQLLVHVHALACVLTVLVDET